MYGEKELKNRNGMIIKLSIIAMITVPAIAYATSDISGSNFIKSTCNKVNYPEIGWVELDVWCALISDTNTIIKQNEKIIELEQKQLELLDHIDCVSMFVYPFQKIQNCGNELNYTGVARP